MNDFAAIDFETANQHRYSVCSVGVVIVRNGQPLKSLYELIRPEPNYYCRWTTEIHGLTRNDTDEADPFPIVWQRIAPELEGLTLVAHNSFLTRGVCVTPLATLICLIRTIRSVAPVVWRENISPSCPIIDWRLFRSLSGMI